MLEATTSCVLVQQPGDVVVLNNLVYHSVLLGYRPETPPINKWGAVFGDVIVCREDRVASFRYATKIACGAQNGSEAAWTSLLSAYCVMEGMAWIHQTTPKARKAFFEKERRNSSRRFICLSALSRCKELPLRGGAKNASGRRQ
ncbi:hypothetical protein PPTG_03100 [Phytophthora nicotianae INRA-310]|uniref:Uncharacterized protein n=3 Tax=Phytophthora nicotianae TaxID=4792 RepID=W2R657_PHYN3|nr:hypothetical protein PPTG_03100 [Phytophthora nicotianae INRA-310]ETM41703.1 hypothetical protein L914_12542 [Phytophthora nicotianae]ETN20000.1 hypothetical protein PPTG_03100 [Phytophthora nicotianae INRA-310]ETO70395.1 hypothetical protein F444_13117 [Phytophthora nicotianae P1976]